MVNAVNLRSTFLTSVTQSALMFELPNIHPFMHTFTHRWRCQARRVTASSSGAVRGSCLAQGHVNTQLGGAGDQTRNPLVTSQPALTQL